MRKFYNLSFFTKVKILVLGVKKLFLQFLVDILLLGSGSVDPHILADPDPGSQNLADPTDPDPKHWMYLFTLHSWCVPDNAYWNIASHILSLQVVFLCQSFLVLTVVKHFQTVWSIKLWNWKTTYLTYYSVMHTDTFHLISLLLNCFMTTSNNQITSSSNSSF